MYEIKVLVVVVQQQQKSRNANMCPRQSVHNIDTEQQKGQIGPSRFRLARHTRVGQHSSFSKENSNLENSWHH